MGWITDSLQFELASFILVLFASNSRFIADRMGCTLFVIFHSPWLRIPVYMKKNTKHQDVHAEQWTTNYLSKKKTFSICRSLTMIVECARGPCQECLISSSPLDQWKRKLQRGVQKRKEQEETLTKWKRSCLSCLRDNQIGHWNNLFSKQISLSNFSKICSSFSVCTTTEPIKDLMSSNLNIGNQRTN